MAEQWEITDHVCRLCMGRVLKRKDGEVVRFLCSNCEATGEGNVKTICACGTRGEKIRCVRQEHPTPIFPSVIVAAEAKRCS